MSTRTESSQMSRGLYHSTWGNGVRGRGCVRIWETRGVIWEPCSIWLRNFLNTLSCQTRELCSSMPSFQPAPGCHPQNELTMGMLIWQEKEQELVLAQTRIPPASADPCSSQAHADPLVDVHLPAPTSCSLSFMQAQDVCPENARQEQMSGAGCCWHSSLWGAAVPGTVPLRDARLDQDSDPPWQQRVMKQEERYIASSVTIKSFCHCFTLNTSKWHS